MSGGYFQYQYDVIRNTYEGQLEDHLLERLLVDFCKLLKELEWYKSGDTEKENYEKAVKKFVKKWIHSKEIANLEYKNKVIKKFEKVIEQLKEQK